MKSCGLEPNVLESREELVPERSSMPHVAIDTRLRSGPVERDQSISASGEYRRRDAVKVALVQRVDRRAARSPRSPATSPAQYLALGVIPAGNRRMTGRANDPGQLSFERCICGMTRVESLEGSNKGGGAMDVVVQHRITDPEKFFSMDAEQVAGGGPAGCPRAAVLPVSGPLDSRLPVGGGLDRRAPRLPRSGYRWRRARTRISRLTGRVAVGLPEAAAAGAY